MRITPLEEITRKEQDITDDDTLDELQTEISGTDADAQGLKLSPVTRTQSHLTMANMAVVMAHEDDSRWTSERLTRSGITQFLLDLV